MSRAQCIVLKDDKILMIRHKEKQREYWCLPGGGINDNEIPEEASLRELKEECNVDGKIIRRTSIVYYGENDINYTYLVDINNQIPKMGYDPELKQYEQIIVDIKWLSLNEIPERDRCFLWASGLISVNNFVNEIEKWGNDISYPQK
ncbi:MAG: NUDIX hydrolase [Candidatus Sericytochromatia bacterium]|nr:NUDIX hydrolase [Candidatus Sericytochromatia bacterium]